MGMLEYCLSCLEHLIDIAPRIKLVFWDTFFRDHLIRASNISTRVRGAVSFHRNLYRNLVERYPRNVIDIEAYMTEEMLSNVCFDEDTGRTGPGLWRDNCGHPNVIGFRFIQTVVSDFFRSARTNPGSTALAEQGENKPAADFAREWVKGRRDQNFQ